MDAGQPLLSVVVTVYNFKHCSSAHTAHTQLHLFIKDIKIL